ncbi:MAG: hypothetical protein RIF32_22345 [Leptospirales bacterium]|jgi:hypothetical protein
MNKNKTDAIMVRAFIALLILVLLGLVLVFAREKNLYHMVLLVTLDLGLVASLIANFFLYRRIRILKGEEPEPRKTKSRQRGQAPGKPAPPKTAVIDPKLLPDPGLAFRFDMSKGEPSRRVTIGQREGTIKTYSTQIIDGHLELEIRVKEDPNRDIYSGAEKIVQSYQVDLRRGARVMIHLPGMERFREMDSRERLLVQPEPDQSGDFQFTGIEPRNPIRFQLGDRLRHDGKFAKGFIEFHLFTKEQETAVGDYIRIDKLFFLRVYKIFPGYDTAHPDAEGLYPMIDPYITRS